MALNKRERALVRHVLLLNKLAQPRITPARRKKLEQARSETLPALTSLYPDDFDELCAIVQEVAVS